MPHSVIRTASLTKKYGRVVGVSGLDLEVESGEVFGFLGPNGAGKTTAIRLLMGMLRPTAGRAEVFGLDTWRQSVAVREKVGYLPGDAALYDRMTGEQHVRFVASFSAARGVEDNGRALAERLELDLGRKVGDCSKGMRQKLAIVLAVMKMPPLLIMDEPTNALDPRAQKLLYDILNELRGEQTTVLFSSHNLPEVERIADRVGILRSGNLAGTKRIEDLREMRLRNVEVIFEGGVPGGIGLESIPGVSDVTRLGNRISLKLKGDINPLLKAVARYDVADFSVAHASLADAFLEFYAPGSAGAPGEEPAGSAGSGGEDAPAGHAGDGAGGGGP